jgi:small subunit ribosomal protein S16
MVRIRLRKTGLAHQPSYRIIVADRESPRDGRFLEIIGTYNPRTNPSTILVKEARAFQWMRNGAQPSESVTRLFNQIGLTGRFDRLKAGESEETLLAEADAAKKARIVSIKTRSDITPVKKVKAGDKPKEEKAA